ncbi:hypothetical protein J4Q44_G00193190 [Coregonus suidteri]|uniref:Uncharacterized protein n=1 Tax=Coregonus suidteri TaxID=861788 RepID=A0AAN8LK94_9TELE
MRKRRMSRHQMESKKKKHARVQVPTLKDNRHFHLKIRRVGRWGLMIWGILLMGCLPWQIPQTQADTQGVEGQQEKEEEVIFLTLREETPLLLRKETFPQLTSLPSHELRQFKNCGIALTVIAVNLGEMVCLLRADWINRSRVGGGSAEVIKRHPDDALRFSKQSTFNKGSGWHLNGVKAGGTRTITGNPY